MKKLITAIRVHALSIYAETSTNDYIDVMVSGQLSDDVKRLLDFDADYAYDADTNTVFLEWNDVNSNIISWAFTLNKETGWFEGK